MTVATQDLKELQILNLIIAREYRELNEVQECQLSEPSSVDPQQINLLHLSAPYEFEVFLFLESPAQLYFYLVR